VKLDYNKQIERLKPVESICYNRIYLCSEQPFVSEKNVYYNIISQYKKVSPKHKKLCNNLHVYFKLKGETGAELLDLLVTIIENYLRPIFIY